MKTSTRNKKINIVTLGCSKNIVDSEQLMGQLTASGIEVTHDSNEPSDVIVVNTCGFIADAKQESVDTILESVEAKKAGLTGKVYVMGCLSERYRKDLTEEIDHVDGFFGTHQLPDIVSALGADYRKELVGERRLTTPAHYAYLKISEGCNRTCSFCAIPLMRGQHRSIMPDQLVSEAERLASKGVRELILIAQDLTYYGVDLFKKRVLGNLLRRLAEVEGIEWIRLQYTYPTDFPVDILDVMREDPKICKYVDMPLQHISDPILKSMRRFINKDRTLKLLDEIRNRVPGVALRTTLITGFPGETEEDFNLLKEFVKAQEFDRLGVFTYSHEEDTRAYALEDSVPAAVKQERMEEIMEIQRNISLRKNEQKIGKTFKVMIDRREGEFFIGRTEFDSPEVDNEVLIRRDDLCIGQFYDAKITGADDYDLYSG